MIPNDGPGLIQYELAWQRRLLRALARGEPRPDVAIRNTRRRIEALTAAMMKILV